MSNSNSPIRVFLKFKADDIPGIPQRRYTTLSESFFLDDLGRNFDDETDWIHVPANIDEPGAKCWMIMDFNKDVTVNLDNVPIRCYRVSYFNGDL